MLSSLFLKTPAEYITNYVSSSISHEMNSEYFLRQQGISGLEQFNPDSPKSRDWLDSLKHFQNPEDFLRQDYKRFQQMDAERGKKSIPDKFGKHKEFEKVPDILNTPFIGSLIIEINSNIVYSSSNPGRLGLSSTTSASEANKDNSESSNELIAYFSDIQSYTPLFDSKGNVIGSVTAKVNPQYMIAIYIMIITVLIFIAVFSLIVSNIISRILTIPAISPIYRMEEAFSKIASENFNPSDIKQIELKKRPLREIETLVGSTNLIMQKLQDYNKTLSDQKLLLENQNEELEAQNEELIESKKKIEEAQTLLVQSENMASIGQLTAAITHEINTPLGAINSNVQLCNLLMNSLLENQTIQADTELYDTMSQIREANSINVFACQRVTEIIKSLKTFSKLDQAEFQEADIIESIKSVLVLTSNLWKKKITIHQEFDSIPLVKCFPGLLNQVFMNVIVNAIQSIENKGDIFIKTYSDGDSVYVSIKDNGIGIREENLAKIFEPGYSTKGAGLGMGLGLSICMNIIRKHNGNIDVVSEPGTGTEFIIRIPKNPQK